MASCVSLRCRTSAQRKEKEAQDKLQALKAEVEAWAGKFPMPGH